MAKLLISLLLLIVISFSCNQSTNENTANDIELSPEQFQVKELEAKVLETHDEVMPLMGSLVSSKDQLEIRNQELSNSQSSEAADEVIINNLVINNLDVAYELMMDWMRNYHPVDIDSNNQANLKYLQEELDKIIEVQKQVNIAMKSAEEALDTVEP